MTYLDERFDLTPSLKLLGPHALRHLPRVALDTSNDGMRIWALLGAIVELLYDDDLLASVATLEGYRDLGILNNPCRFILKDNRYFSWLEN